ncbi:hypothetical protein SY89_03509 [Halolamina pelagica]|uniref:VWFA domain-containing protein n=1 Tax=Halolamina pelagica TaxID=699431 RepID=A0A0N8HZE4_9EURY|nr:VWA domain-containing protein [Halolamina pelagica]KPN29275.1 hypothetical protein SY89_03509 [Halolamina pelagica]
MTKKITTMKRRAKGFVDEIHCDGRHYGVVNSFDSSCSLGTLRPSSSSLKSDIRKLSAGGQTALYDSVYHSIGSLAKAHYDADRHGIPMAVLTFTDGKENNSTRGVGDVRKLIRDLEFFPSNNCYFIIAGVGEASETQMQELCRDDYGLYISASDIDEVFSTFKRLLLKLVLKDERAAVKSRKNGKVVKVEGHKRSVGASIKEVDYALNLDCSGSMG